MRTFNFATNEVASIVNKIIIDAVVLNASDIHFDPEENYLKVRIRVDGDLRDYASIENNYKNNLITRIKLLAGMNITETRLPQDGAIKSTIGNKNLDLRVSTLPTNHGEKLVIRILDYYMSLKGIKDLGFSKENLDKVNLMLKNPNGIILVTGATGSGKSTTVYGMLQELNKEETNIITVEDPIEMNLEGINQIQVNSEIGLDFSTVLRSILRQDPNIILIGEIRDSETARIAIRASITGHLVLSTLHTNNSLTTIERLLDMDVERYLLSASLKGIISQNLTKKLCPKCRKLRKTTEAEKQIFKKVLNIDVNEVYEAVGCPECHKGYKGRFSIQEVLIITDEIREAINEKVPRQQLKEMIYKNNVKTLLQDGLEKVIEGKTTISEILKLIDLDDDYSELFKKTKNEQKLVKEVTPPILDTPINELFETKKETIEKPIQQEKEINTIPTFDSFQKETKKEEKSYMRNKNSYTEELPKQNTNSNLETTQDIYQAIMNKNNLINDSKIKTKEDLSYTDNLLDLINNDLL